MVTGTKVHQSSTICVNFSYSVRADDRFQGVKVRSYTSIEVPQNNDHIFGRNGGESSLKLIIEGTRWLINF